MQRAARMKREMQIFNSSPPHGITCWPKEDQLNHLEAQVIGTEGTPYEKGVFKLDIKIPERYPFEPPQVQFITPIYHPNIDNAGRICLDSLKMPPKGAWKPALNISTILTSIQLLMAEPNPEDPLMTDISDEFKYNRPLYTQNAKQWTQKYAVDSQHQGNSNKENLQADTEDSSSDSDSSDEDAQEEQERSNSTKSKKRLPSEPLTNSTINGKKLRIS